MLLIGRNLTRQRRPGIEYQVGDRHKEGFRSFLLAAEVELADNAAFVAAIAGPGDVASSRQIGSGRLDPDRYCQGRCYSRDERQRRRELSEEPFDLVGIIDH